MRMSRSDRNASVENGPANAARDPIPGHAVNLHRLRQRIINLDRIPRDIFDHRELAKEWDALRSMATTYRLPFFAHLCRAKWASQLGHAQILRQSIRAAFGEAIPSLAQGNRQEQSPKWRPERKYVRRIYLALSEALKAHGNCPQQRRDGRLCIRNHLLFQQAPRHGADRNRVVDRLLRAELSKDLPQVFELLGTHFLNAAVYSGTPEARAEAIDLALHSVFLGFRAVVPAHRRRRTKWDDAVLEDSPSRVANRVCELLVMANALLRSVLHPDRAAHRDHVVCCYYTFESSADNDARSNAIPDSRRRSVMHMVLLSMRLALFHWQTAPGQANVKRRLTAIIDEIRQPGRNVHLLPVWLYAFAGDLCLQLAGQSRVGAARYLQSAQNLHSLNVHRVRKEYDPHYEYQQGAAVAEEKEIEALLEGSNPPPRRDSNIVYSLTRIARAELFLGKHGHPQNRPLLHRLLDELRFEYDAMFWSSLDKEAAFLQVLDSSSAAHEIMARSPTLTSGGTPTPSTPLDCPAPARGHLTQIGVEASHPAHELELHIHVLRSWSSYTPFIARSQDGDTPSKHSRGGGYLVRCGDLGIAIDPGPGFVDNLLDAGLSLSDVNVVFVSHNHPDHYSDLVTLLTLASRKGHSIGHVFLAPNVYHTQKLGIEASLAGRSRQESDGSKILPFCYTQICSFLPDGPKSGWSLILEGVPAFHEDVGWNTLMKRPTKPEEHQGSACDRKGRMGHLPGFGLRLLVKKGSTTRFCAYFTGDTAWERSIGGETVNLGDAWDGTHVDLLVAHMSKVEFKEIARGSYYPKHLGVLGSAMLVDKLKPDFAVISEWGEEYSGYRNSICRAIERASIDPERRTFRCIPGDRGMEIVKVLHKAKNQDAHLLSCCSYKERSGERCGKRERLSRMGIDRRFVDGEEAIRFLCEVHSKF